ncbi:MAG: hypothetical protein JJ858_16540 [Rhizobiaceae bacterium]|nr:hypothetical protein [Rhizobiaceae bacterium]
MKLIYTNGDSASSKIEDLKLADKVVPWRDILHEGPLEGIMPLAKRSEERAKFIVEFDGGNFADIHQSFKDRDKTLFYLNEYSRVELWFEHDLYDQLQLLQILNFAHQNLEQQDFFLVQSDDYLGEMQDDAFRALPALSKPVTKEMKAYASNAWTALTHKTPDLLIRVMDNPDMPFIAPAIRRLVMEYPDSQSGLPTSIFNALTLLLNGPTDIGRLFHHMQNCELAKFMGDLSFARYMDELGTCTTPVIAGHNLIYSTSKVCGRKNLDQIQTYFKQKIHLTDFGRQVMERNANHVMKNGIDRWIGGVHLTTENLYFYDMRRVKIVQKSCVD